MGVCYWEGDPAYLTVSWIILDIDAKLLLKGCWMWVCVPLSSSLPLVSLSVCVCVCVCVCVQWRKTEGRREHSPAQTITSLAPLSLYFFHKPSCLFCFLIFSASLVLLFVLLSTLLTRYSSPSLSALSPSSPALLLRSLFSSLSAATPFPISLCGSAFRC